MIKILDDNENVRKLILKDFIEFATLDFVSDGTKPLLEGTVGNIGAIKLSINANDHEPPHLHLMINQMKLPRLNLDTYTYMDTIPKNFSRKDQKNVVSWAQSHNKDDALIKQFRGINESMTVYYYHDNGELRLTQKLKPLLG